MREGKRAPPLSLAVSTRILKGPLGQSTANKSGTHVEAGEGIGWDGAMSRGAVG